MAGAGYRLFVAGAVFTAAQANTYFMEQTQMVFASTAARDAALTTVKAEGNLTYQSDTNTLTSYTGAAWSSIGPVSGALTTWTPVLTQSGNVTVTNTHSTYSRIGRLVFAQFLLAVTGTGTGANVVTISLPVNNSGLSSSDVMGFAYLNDTSASNWFKGALQVASASTVKIQDTTLTSFSYLGVSGFSAALAAGDSVSGFVVYEAAADA